MSQFDYWKRGVRVTKPLTKLPKGQYSLVKAQIEHGDFRPSPYWKMAMEEEDLFNKEVAKYAKSKPYLHPDTLEEFKRTRWVSYRRRIEKLQQAHIDYEESRLGMLRKNLISSFFGVDLWDEAIAIVDGDEMELYRVYKDLYAKHHKEHEDNLPF